MRDMVTCFSDHAVRVSETTCSSTTHHSHPCTFISPNTTPSPSIQNAVVSIYQTPLLSPHNQPFLITVTWTRNHLGQAPLSMGFGDGPSPSPSFNLYNSSRLFRKNKGKKSFDVNSSKIEVFWDLSNADFQSGPEPTAGFYVLVTIDSQLGLALGDLAQESAVKRLKSGPTLPKPALLSRREHFSGNALYSTKARFCDSDGTHEIVIQCSEDQEKLKQPALYVSIDKRTVIKIRRLQWNFRGNQTVFVDGLLVDLMWDVHDWFFNPVLGSGSGSGQAVFMFKTRSGSDSRLWLEDKVGHKDQDSLDFSLLLYASSIPNQSPFSYSLSLCIM